MENNVILSKLEDIQKELRPFEKQGLDTSSLKIFVKNCKEFLKLNNQSDLFQQELSFEEKLSIIKSFLEDTKAFPKIENVINFANERLEIDFKNQKKSRETTITLIINQISSKPELKDKLKEAVLSINNEMIHNTKSKKSSKQIITTESFGKWTDIIRNI
jgi:Cu2+-containing amine oxidase